MSESKTHLVVFLDFLGFSTYYDLIERGQTEKNKENGFLIFNHLYKKYIDKLEDSLKIIPKNLTKNLITDDFAQSLPLRTQVLPISDSIIITIDCENKELFQASLIIFFMLGSAILETLKPIQIEDVIKDICPPFSPPLRGGVSYGYGLSFIEKAKKPYIFSAAFNESVKLEKCANWPRIAISPKIVENIKSTPLVKIIYNENGTDYFDFLKFMYFGWFNSIPINKNDVWIRFVKNIADKYKNHIHINMLYSHAWCNDFIRKNQNDKSERIRTKYKKWRNYYEEWVNWLIKEDSRFREVDLSFYNDAHTKFFE